MCLPTADGPALGVLADLAIKWLLSHWGQWLVGTEPGHGADVFPLTDPVVSLKAERSTLTGDGRAACSIHTPHQPQTDGDHGGAPVKQP